MHDHLRTKIRLHGGKINNIMKPLVQLHSTKIAEIKMILDTISTIKLFTDLKNACFSFYILQLRRLLRIQKYVTESKYYQSNTRMVNAKNSGFFFPFITGQSWQKLQNKPTALPTAKHAFMTCKACIYDLQSMSLLHLLYTK